MLIKDLDICLQENSFDYFFLETTTSTMDEAKYKINYIKNNFIILAKEQTFGRGRRGSKWISPPGNIYSSIALSIKIPIVEYFKFNILTSFAVKDSLEHIGINKILFKWPNDIYCNQEKISGILQESYTNQLNKKFLVIGIGINFLSSPNINNYNTTHVSKYIKNISIDEYFKIFINYFLFYFNNYISNKNFNIFEQYKKFQMFLNQNINIKINNKKILNGIFNGINDDGSLILKQKDKVISIYSGQIL